ncbi:hypothetical protein FSARC_11527 [Fusarium sarcochroum]|uniref:C2H2-type domain-containing protein n=1 Tax=Fusarium sarcochroum TaxID=1208366 RepID=A0A8H4TFB5_9HYPO|nr:hypothetical protein FSARC_11527 [Fusarium sarcochroum]
MDTYETSCPGSPPAVLFHPDFWPHSTPPPERLLSCLPAAGVANLVTALGNGRDPEIALEAGREGLLHDVNSQNDEPYPSGPPGNSVINKSLLQHLAADALQDASPAPAPSSFAASILQKTTHIFISDEPPSHDASTARYRSGNGVSSPLITSSGGHLSPPHHGICVPAGEPKEALPSQSLPSLRATFGEIRDLAPERLSEHDLGRAPSGPSSTFPISLADDLGPPSSSIRNLLSSHPSPPRGNWIVSPHHATGAGVYYYTANAGHPRAVTDNSSSNAGETPNTDQCASTSATSTSINSTSITDRTSIDEITHPEPLSGSYTLKGCPRSEGGKGFKRKNELIRHGLVHDSPGYVCPFCPEREHKYPRPDNLQRHVRVHHVDIDKDDPQLRDVLAQRPDGPSRGRRRQGPP